MQSSSKPHGVIAKTLHWGFVGLFLYGLSKGLDNVNQLADATLLNFEMTFAGLFLATIIARFFYMRRFGSTALPETTSPVMKRAAKYGHLAIYISVGLIPITGMMIGGLYMLGITGGVLMAAVIGMHELSLVSSYAILALHIAAALYHRFLGDGVWSAMVPVFKEKRGI